MFMIIRMSEYDYDGDVDREEIQEKIESGELSAYGVGMTTEEAGKIVPDYDTFVWGVISVPHLEGIYESTEKIPDENIRWELENS